MHTCALKANHISRTASHGCLCKGSTTGLIGATPCKGRFRASIMVAGKQRHIGVFDTAQQAHEAYIQFKREKHAGCTI
jgi:hypothetical protein